MQLVLEQAGLTKKGREKAAQIKEARMLQQKQNRERLKMSFLRRKVILLRFSIFHSFFSSKKCDRRSKAQLKTLKENRIQSELLSIVS